MNDKALPPLLAILLERLEEQESMDRATLKICGNWRAGMKDGVPFQRHNPTP